MTTPFDAAHARVLELVGRFHQHAATYLQPSYQEAEARKDFIDPVFKALGWDVDHEREHNPYEQEVKVERGVSVARSQKRADYAFYCAPNFRDVRFFVEAKKPSVDLDTSADAHFQTLRYGYSAGTPLAVLTDFEQVRVLDCRARPHPGNALDHVYKAWHYTDFRDAARFAEFYWLFSREAHDGNLYQRRIEELPKPKGGAKQRGLFRGGYQPVDASFLAEIEEHREALAKAFKKADIDLDSETLTAIVQRTLDRLVFLRFLEDKQIETEICVSDFGKSAKGAWADFLAASRRLDNIYNGIVFKQLDRLDDARLVVDDDVFGDICERLAAENSPYNFDAIPIHILGSIYERFLGRVIRATDKRVFVEEKPDVRKAGGVYYTPEYIVRYIVAQTVGKLIAGKAPVEITKLRFADIACGSGSFLLGVYDVLLRHHADWYNRAENEKQTKKDGCIRGDDGHWRLSLAQRRAILQNNVYGVDIDRQAVEVAQLSLFLKLLEEERATSARQYQLDYARDARLKKLLPDLSTNIICGNSLVETDILDEQLFDRAEERRLNAMSFATRFPSIIKAGGFDAVIGNPPYLYSAGKSHKKYFVSHYPRAEYQADYYIYFIERAVRLAKASGYVAMIVSDSWLTGKYFSKIREWLLGSFTLQSVTTFNYLPFDGAAIENSIFVVQKIKISDQVQLNRYVTPDDLVHQNSVVPDVFRNLGLIDIHFSEVRERLMKKFERVGEPFAGFFNVNRGVHAYRVDGYGRSKFQSGPQTKRDKEERSYHASERKDDTYFPEVKGKHLHRYGYKWDGTFISYGDWLAEPRNPDLFMGPKLALRKIVSPKLVCTLIEEPVVLDQSIYVAVCKSKDADVLRCALGILASSIGGWYLINRHCIYDKLYPWYTKDQLAKFPVALNTTDDGPSRAALLRRLSKLVEATLANQQNIRNASSEGGLDYYQNRHADLDRQIDVLVYELYGLTNDEIALVEGRA